MMSGKQFLFMQGAHRSGTSALANLMHALGVQLGVDLLDPQKGVNDEGFWEHRFVVDTNEAIFRRLNSSWYDFRQLPPDFWTWSVFDDIRLAIRDWLEREFGGQVVVGIKDPRLCRTLPLWHQVVTEAGWEASAIVIYRGAHNVASSLNRRDGFPDHLGKLIWLAYNLDAELNSRGMKTAFIEYDYLMDNKNSMIADIARYFSGLSLNSENQEIGRIIREDLRHHRDSVPYGEESDDLDFICREIMKNFSEERSAAAISRMDHLRNSFYQYLARSPGIADAFHDMARRFIGVNQDLSRIGGMHSHALAVVRQRDCELREKNTVIEKSQQENISLSSTLASLLSENQHLRDSLESAKKEKSALAEKRVNSSIAQLLTSLSGEGEAREWGRVLADRQKRIDDLQLTLDRRVSELQEVTTKARGLDKLLHDAEKKLSSTLSHLEALEGNAALMSEASREQGAVYESAQKELAVLIGKNAELLREMATLSSHVAAYEKRNRSLVDGLYQSQSKINMLDSEIASFKENIQAMRAQIGEMQYQESFFDIKFGLLSERALEAQHLLNKKRDALEECEVAVVHQEKTLSELMLMLDEARQTVAVTQKKYHGLVSSRWVRWLLASGLVKVAHE